MSDVVALDEAVAEGRREVVELLSRMSTVVAHVADTLEAIVEPDAADGEPTDWPLPADLVLERSQLVAFVETVKQMSPERQKAFRDVFAVELTKAKQTDGMRATHELNAAPVTPETKGAAAELSRLLAEIRREFQLAHGDLADALRPIALGRWAM